MPEEGTLPGQPTINVNLPPGFQAAQQPQGEPLTAERLEQLLNGVRTEEKNKLYPLLEEQKSTIQTLQEQISVLTQEREQRLAAEQSAQQQAEEAARLKAEEEMSARELIAQRDQEWQSRFAALQVDRDREAALRQKEQEFASLVEYRHRRLQEEGDGIGPWFADYVGGNSKEEIDASIELAKQKSAAMMAELAQDMSRQQPPPRPVPFTAGPPTDLAASVGQQQRQFSPQEIQEMSMEDFAKYRNQMLSATSDLYYGRR